LEGIFVNVWDLGRRIAGIDRLSETSHMGFFFWDGITGACGLWVVYIVFADVRRMLTIDTK
jgi:hypothetical protein